MSPCRLVRWLVKFLWLRHRTLQRQLCFGRDARYVRRDRLSTIHRGDVAHISHSIGASRPQRASHDAKHMVYRLGECQYSAYDRLFEILHGAIASVSDTYEDYMLILEQKVGTVFNIVVVIIFVIWFPVGAINQPKTNDSHAVWTTFKNGTEWPIGWATIMGKWTMN